ncbi:MAG TPA: PPOX class F420-dependent oxidoreductase [Candidatus Binatia bacterium]|jgi:PPOX class probable F420-dependent enzyme
MSADDLQRLANQRTVLLTTYRRDGRGVGTPVNIAVENGRAYVRTYESAWKLKRIRNNPDVEVAPSTARGKPTGPALRARARILSGDETERASRAINRKHPLLHGVFVPMFHRLRREKTVYLEIYSS